MVSQSMNLWTRFLKVVNVMKFAHGYPAMDEISHKPPTPRPAPAGTPEALSLGVWVGVGDPGNVPLKHQKLGNWTTKNWDLTAKNEKNRPKEGLDCQKAGIIGMFVQNSMASAYWIPTHIIICLQRLTWYTERRSVPLVEILQVADGALPRACCSLRIYIRAHAGPMKASLGMGGFQPEDHQNSKKKQ
jgi:hypothetical protein